MNVWKEFCLFYPRFHYLHFISNNLIGQNSGYSLSHLFLGPMKPASQVSTCKGCFLFYFCFQVVSSPWQSQLSPGYEAILFIIIVPSVCTELSKEWLCGYISVGLTLSTVDSLYLNLNDIFRYLSFIKERAGCPPYTRRLQPRGFLVFTRAVHWQKCTGESVFSYEVVL